jgi:GNAT superfamily N-acetyltransferase
MKVLTTFYRRLIVFTFPLQEFREPKQAPPGVEVRLVCEDDVSAYLRLRPDQSEALVRSRLALGDRCFAVWRGREILHAGWVATRSACLVPHLEREIRLLPGDVHTYDHYTRADARRLGCARLRMVVSLSTCRDEGRLRTIGLVAWENAAALAAARAARYQALGLVSWARFGRWRRFGVEAWSDEPMPGFVAPGPG